MWWWTTAWAAEVALVATAGSGGVGSGADELSLPVDVLAALDALADAVHAQHGFMVRGREAVWSDDGRVATLQAWLDAPGACGEPSAMRTVETRDEVVFVAEPVAASAFVVSGELSLSTRDSAVRRCAGPMGDVWYAGGDGVDPLEGGPWEFRLALHITSGPDRLWAIGRPVQEMSRRVALIESLASTGAHWIDGGSFVDGLSTVDAGQLSRHRPLGFEVLQRLEPTVLVPGRAELAPGPRRFLEEAGELPYVAANWVVEENSLTDDLPDHWRGELDGVDVAVIGLVDPVVARDNPLLGAQGIALSDPVDAAQDVIDRLKVDPPELTLVVGAFRPQLLAQLQEQLRRVDVLVGNPAPSVDRLDTVTLSLQDAFGGEDEPTVTLPTQGVTWAHLDIEDGQLVAARYRPTRITAAIDPDEETLARITAVRQEAYVHTDDEVLPSPPEGSVARWTDAEWEKLLCEAVLERTGADFALLPDLPPPPAVPGPLTEKLVLDQLPLADELRGRYILGDRLQRLSDKAYEVVPVSCGIQLGASVTVGGRSVDLLRAYRLVATDKLLLDGPTGSLVAEAVPTRILDPDDWDPGPTTLVAGIREGMLGHGRPPMKDRTDEVLARSPSTKVPLWMLRLTRVSLSAARFQGVDDAVYSDVPETLATSPSSLTLLADADAGLEYSDAKIAWDVRQRLMFTRLAIEPIDGPTEVSEPADDWQSSTSLTLPVLGVKVGSTWSPYSELLFDSELTAVEEEDGTLNPLQRDLSLTVGLSTSAGPLTLLRLGAFGLRDLSVLDKPWEYGGRAQATTSVSLGAGLLWTSSLDGYVWADTPTADTSDLRFKALFDTRVSLPVLRWLTLAPYAQAFAFAGRVPETSDPALSYTLGTSLDLIGALRLRGGGR